MYPMAEHVWVLDVQVFGNVPQPGLLVEWRKRDDGSGWDGLVIAAEAFPQGRGWQVRQRWVPEAHIKACVRVDPPRAG